MTMDITAAKSTEELDAQLLSTLREIDQHNYLYLFECCKNCNVNARQLRFLKTDHIRDLIPKNELGILAEFEYLLYLWQISKGYVSFNTKIQLTRESESNNFIFAQYKPQIQCNSQTVVIAKISTDLNTFNSNLQVESTSSPATVAKEPEELLTVQDLDDPLDEVEAFALENIIPTEIEKCKENYKRNKFLRARDRGLLTTSIIYYFRSRKIKFNSDIMDYVAEQIVEHFPTEKKKYWNNPGNNKLRGRLTSSYTSSYHRERARRLGAKQGKASSKTVESHDEDYDEDNKSIQDWLKSINCEKFSEIVDLWADTMKYRCQQAKNLTDFKSLRDFLNNWPSYKLETGYELLSMDFEYFYPQAMATFCRYWPVHKQNIEAFLEAELKDGDFLQLLENYQLQKASLNEDSSSSVLIYLIHAITQPSSYFKTAAGHVRYTITDSQYSMMRLIIYKSEMDEYTKPHPCIFVVGESLLEVEECYVVFLDLRYKLSFVNCLAVCVQIFTVFKVEDPQPSQCFWEFIRGYLFNIAKDKEKTNAVTENMCTYLETAASSSM